MERSSGVLLHPTSLPGRHGIGDLGAGALGFLDWLVEAGQEVWQFLPLGPAGLGNSPYTPVSAFAGNPLLISPEALVADRLVSADEVDAAAVEHTDRVDYGLATERKEALLRRAFAHWRRSDPTPLAQEYQEFTQAPEQAFWLDDWALFAALKQRFEHRDWLSWPAELRERRTEDLARAANELSEECEFHRFSQFLFFRQWTALRAEAARRGIVLLGDLPIYVALDSSDAWAHQELFDLEPDGRPRTVAGVPPDYFSDTGQRWGNPTYRWDRLEQQGFAWWTERMRANLRLADVVRIDHFRGLEAYWSVPAAEETAVNGEWRPGPGSAFFHALRDALGELPLVAEDLGVITPEVDRLRREFGLPGMKVLQFGFDQPGSDHAPHAAAPDSVVYTGTHDNDTCRGWFESLGAEHRRNVLDYLGTGGDEIHWQMIRSAWTTAGRLAIAPAQDLLGLGAEARMNVPGRPQDNWEWRLPPGAPGSDEARRLRRMTEVADRLPKAENRPGA